jgi:tetratricopeptide (TPR) repeat protein
MVRKVLSAEMARRRSSARKVGRSGDERATSKDPYPKKYWWLLLVALPIILALIQQFPNVVNLFKSSDEVKPLAGMITIGSMFYVNTLNVLEKEYEKTHGEPLKDQAVKDKFEHASGLAKQGNYKEAIALLEEIAPKADVAAIANNLGVLRAKVGDLAGAQKDFEMAAAQNPKDPVAKANAEALDKLPSNLLAKENGGQVILAPNDRAVRIPALRPLEEVTQRRL